MIADFIHFIDSLPLFKLSTSGTPYSYGIPLSALNAASEVLHTGLGENDLLGSMIAKHLGATASQTHSDGFVLHASINLMKKKQYYESCMNFLFLCTSMPADSNGIVCHNYLICKNGGTHTHLTIHFY